MTQVYPTEALHEPITASGEYNSLFGAAHFPPWDVPREHCSVQPGWIVEEPTAPAMSDAEEGPAIPNARVLIVDDDPALLHALPQALRLRMKGLTVDTANSGAVALQRIADWDYDAIVTDIKMPAMDGFALLTEIRRRRPDTPTLLITGHGEHALAIDALRGGAYDFVQKPIDRDYFIASLRRAIQIAALRRQVKEQQVALQRHAQRLQRTVEKRTHELHEVHRIIESPLRWLVGPCRRMAKVIEQIKQVADSPLTILIQGETGTGKELVARAVHHLSARRRKPFVAVDCGAIPDTLIESELFGHEKGAFTGADQRKEGQCVLADGGSLFLDEIVNLPLATQVKLLRALQERQVQPLGGTRPVRVDARIIAASNVSLESEVRSGRFRQDVYYRLNEFVITLPALREREDILDLANRFLVEASMEFGSSCREISKAAAQILLHYAWPGNVRELRNVIRRAALLASDTIRPEHLSLLSVDSPSAAPDEELLQERSSLKEIADAAAAGAEQQAIHRVLQLTKGNKSEAARVLRTDYKTLHLKMKQYGIDAASFKERRSS
jgi:DNA-binding NtrC family response regulator